MHLSPEGFLVSAFLGILIAEAIEAYLDDKTILQAIRDWLNRE